jgi:membrane dipeptidase
VRDAKRDGVPPPDGSPDADLEIFRSQIRAASGAGVHAFMAPVATREYGEEVHGNLLRFGEFASALEAEVLVARGLPDVHRAAAEGRVALIPCFQGMQMVEADLGLIPGYRAAGIGVMTLTHPWKTPFGDGVFERSDRGLTVRGQMAVESLNAAGVLLDLSLVGRHTSLQAMEASVHPVIFSRSNAAAIHDHPANLTDEQLRVCARVGGVVGVSAFPSFVSESTTPTLEQVLDHVDYLAETMGVDHVALGLDFDDAPRLRFPTDPAPEPPYRYPQGLEGFGDLPRIRDRLLGRGYSDTDTGKIFGGNFLRVLGRVWHGQADPGDPERDEKEAAEE